MIVRITSYVFLFSIYFFLNINNLLFASTTLNIPLTIIPKLDPYMGNDISMNKVVNQIAEGLVQLDDSLAPTPLLATKWSTDTKRNTITFTLRDRKFHDGSSVTSRDIFNSFMRSRESGSDLTSQIKNFKTCKTIKRCDSFKVITNHQFKIALTTNNFSFFLRKLAGIEGVIFKKGKDGDFVGTGPYKVKSIDKASINLAKADFVGHFDHIHFVKVAQDEAITLFKSGKLDVISDVSYKVDPNEISKIYPYQDKTVVTFGLVVNLRKGIFKDKETRKALSLAINKKQFLEQIGMNGVVASGIVPIGFLGHQNTTGHFDPLLASKIISRKVPRNKRKILIGLRQKYRNNPAFEQYLKAALNTVGLNLEFQYDSFQNILDDFQKDKYDLILKGDGPRFYEPSTVFAPYITGQFVNISDYSNKKLDQLYYQYEKERLDQNKVRILRKMEELLAKDIPFVPLFHPKFRTWHQPSIDTKNRKKLSIKFWEFPYHRYGKLDVNQHIGGKL